jgi:diacylglycerol kinase family enzyme
MYCGSNYALSHCLVGMEPIAAASIKKIEKHTFLKRFRQMFSPTMFLNYMCLIGVMNLRVIRQNYRLLVDDENLSGVHLVIHILNSPRFGDSQYYPLIDPADGYLDVLASGDMSVLKMFIVANKILKTLKELKLEDEHTIADQEKYSGLVTYRRAKSISVASEGSLILNLDGELFYDKQVSVEIRPAAVRIIAPNLVTGAAHEL